MSDATTTSGGSMKSKRTVRRVTRDFAVSMVATGLLAYEVLLGGGRPAVLTACVSLLLSPVIMRVDEARRVTKGDDDAK